jgi:hypothetical protein
MLQEIVLFVNYINLYYFSISCYFGCMMQKSKYGIQITDRLTRIHENIDNLANTHLRMNELDEYGKIVTCAILILLTKDVAEYITESFNKGKGSSESFKLGYVLISDLKKEKYNIPDAVLAENKIKCYQYKSSVDTYDIDCVILHIINDCSLYNAIKKSGLYVLISYVLPGKNIYGKLYKNLMISIMREKRLFKESIYNCIERGLREEYNMIISKKCMCIETQRKTFSKYNISQIHHSIEISSLFSKSSMFCRVIVLPV